MIALAPASEAILTCFATISAAVINAAPLLQVIGRYGIGVDNIDMETASGCGILVTNVPAYCRDEVAEHTLALVLALARGITTYGRSLRGGDWDLSRGAPLFRLSGKTLGLVGLGSIGQAVCKKAHGLGLRAIAYDRSASAEEMQAIGAEKVDSLQALAAACEFLCLHLPLDASTRHVIDERVLRAMRPTAFLINTARGGLVDQSALVRALREGWIAGAGLDVFEPERLPLDHPLLAMDNVIATPHVAFYSEESVHELQVRAAENVAAVLQGRMPAHVVNPKVLDLPRWGHLR